MAHAGGCHPPLYRLGVKERMKEIDFEIIDHTADIGIQLRRPTLDKLFGDAALAMFRLVVPEGDFRPIRRRVVTVVGEDNGQLMVNWLSKLNFLFQTKGFIPVEIDLRIEDGRLRAEIKGDRFDPKRHQASLEIKAVTYHNLAVEKTEEGYSAQILFDV
ncbi:MAG: archease [candidate division KSB1 bacterium]|nr:archease [candidate division KSB1 bacterium]MDZ7345983.1 archease [candidate division KSB1 bacterium]